jgi:hypothetical protein
VEKKYLILQDHLSGEGTSYLSGAHKWRRNIVSFRCTKDNMFLLHFGPPEG